MTKYKENGTVANAKHWKVDERTDPEKRVMMQRWIDERQAYITHPTKEAYMDDFSISTRPNCIPVYNNKNEIVKVIDRKLLKNVQRSEPLELASPIETPRDLFVNVPGLFKIKME